MNYDTAPGWTHDPNTWNDPFEIRDDGSRVYHEDDGWVTHIIEGVIDNRCGAIYPDGDPNPQVGNCGLRSGHESPHSWVRVEWYVLGLSRRSLTNVK